MTDKLETMALRWASNMVHDHEQDEMLLASLTDLLRTVRNEALENAVKIARNGVMPRKDASLYGEGVSDACESIIGSLLAIKDTTHG